MSIYHLTKKSRKITADDTKHIPNKNEGKKLRQIMSTTGLTEEEIRNDKGYRVELANAQKEGVKPKRTETEKWFQTRIKSACKQTGLAKEHPETIKVLDEILERDYNNYNKPWFMHDNLKAKKVIEIYGKK
jgi:hypothetical protein